MARPRPGIRPGVAPRFVEVSKPAPASSPAQDAPPTPSNVTPFAAPKPDQVDLSPLSVEDVDRLWDWVRADREGTTAFLGHTHPNSQAFFYQIGQIAQKELDGSAWMRSIVKGDALIGFVILDPITKTKNPVGTCHIYISQNVRGELPKLLPSILAEGDQQLPNITYFVATQDEAMSALLQSAGFSAQIVLTRAASLGEPHGSEGR